ncbi:LANO_0E01882g1_1 [Lachancea nothofagi CBS 11611]|uniref:ferric-chelate reductase (NADPH) n=1 Tax=Lachancea nothofagi CBS 11611 TaxID=1266666 RepID=A0A1G4JPW4_9SACH|nr:LANO_0E01882g1_1 [Lachancea nothofagi CBS 11611]
MKIHKLQILVLAILAQISQSLTLVDSTLASACIYYEKTFDWGCGSHGNGMKAYKCRCANINWLGTITNCIANNTDSDKLREHAFKHVAGRCQSKAPFNYTVSDMHRFLENGTKYLRDPTAADLDHTVYTTIRVNQTEFDWYYGKFKDYTFAVQRSQWFGWGLVFYWAAIIVVSSLYNLNKKFVGLKLSNKWISRKLVIPSIFEQALQKHPKLRGLAPGPYPNRLQFLIVAVFIVQVFITTGVGYELTLPHPYLTNRWFMNLTLLSYRTDLMSMSLFPIIYFFGIRNNPFIALSGMSYTTFSYFHKWCAYVATILAFIHSIIWTVYSIHDGGYKSWYVDAYWKYGIAAMVLMALLVFHSTKFMRDMAYEAFLFLHQIMNVFFIVCMYYHCNTLGWLGWVWVMVGILAFDRLLRIVRLVLSGGLQKSTLTDCGNGIIKMTLKRPKWISYQPGSFAFIYFLSWNDPWYYQWQSHPFTLLSAAKEDGINGEELVAYFKAQKGITRQMLYRLLKSGEDSIQVRVMVEGPYGDVLPQKVKVERKLVGVAAGLGITAVYAQMLQLLEVQVPQMGSKLYWAVNDVNHISWFENELKWLLSKNCEVTILCTTPKELDEAVFSISDIKLFEKLNVESLFCRPDLTSLTKKEIKQSSEQSRDITFISCGPSAFNVDFRASLSASLCKEQSIDVALLEESFVW